MIKTFTLFLTIAISFLSTEAIAQVVINEVYGGGGNSGATFKNDFIELYNNGDASVALDGWSVQYASATGSTWSITVLAGTIPAKGYYLIKQAAGTGGTTDLPTPNATGTLALASTSGKVALVNNSAALSGSCPTGNQIIDFVGFGGNATAPPNCFEGTATPAPSNTTSVQRDPAGYDTNNNGTDFKIAAPTPTTSNSTPDVSPPVTTSLLPANNATNVAAAFTAIITFNENIAKGTGNIFIKRASDNSTVKTIDVTTAEVSTASRTASFSVSGLIANSSYYIEVSSGAFKDTALNNFAGITGSTTWKFTTGTKIYEANFGSCTSALTEGFTQFSASGAQVWACTAFGRDTANASNTAPYGVQINGFDVTNITNEDWLISPAFNLSETTYPLLSFWSRTAFNGAPLQLKISTNYSGTGDPRLATWTDINGRFPRTASDVWTQSLNINLSTFRQANVYVAFVYKSSNEEGARWTIDDISIDNSAVLPPPSLTISTTDIQFAYTPATNSLVKTFTVTGNDVIDGITVSSTTNFIVSTNGTDYSSSVTFPQAEANNTTRTVYLKFTPLQADVNYAGTVYITTSGLTDSLGVKGTSIDPSKTLEVVSWNIEWFGSASNGPANDSLQQQNVKTVLQNIDADIYGLLEVVDTARLGNIVRQLPGNYSYVVSNFGSHTNPNSATPSPLAQAQKLAFIYKTSMFSNITTSALLSQGINSAADVTTTSYNNWASGRFPYLLNADVTLNGVTKNIKFILIHAKANTSPTIESYNRRKAGADELRSLLDASYASDNIIILGDFNDDLDQTITAGINPPVTSYISFVNDSVNYPSVTLPLSRAGKKTTVSYNDMIDHAIVSSEMRAYYINNSASVLTDVTSLVSAYSATTSDHYPVFSRYSFDPVLLPVTLIKFDARKHASIVELTWKTTNELNCKEFIVERSSDAVNYTVIGKLAASINTGIENNYSFYDNNPLHGNNFYRLKQVDNDGRSSLTRAIKVPFEKVISITLSPNPTRNIVTLTLNNFTDNATVQILNNAGVVLKQQLVPARTTRSLISLDGIANGVYVLKVSFDKQVLTRKLLVQ